LACAADEAMQWNEHEVTIGCSVGGVKEMVIRTYRSDESAFGGVSECGRTARELSSSKRVAVIWVE